MSTATLPTQADTSRQAQTRLRLLDAAAREFAEHGFHHATVRDICKRAEANVAAVNYHFGDKERLYAATLKHWIGVALEKYPPLMGVAADAPAVDRLRGFVRASLNRMLDTGAAGWHGQLMAREMVEPTAAFDSLVAESLRPMVDLLHGIVREIGGPGLTEEQVGRCAMSVVGQCCFYRHARGMVERMFGADLYTEAGLEAVADHITAFSIAGLAACAAGR
ncbi:MAG TPA: CerR family C-terminal domain-containing protein [Humisphaera sp.]